MFTAGLKKRVKSVTAICAYSCLLLTFAALAMAQSDMIPSMQLSTQTQLNQAVTGNDVLVYIQKTHGADALSWPRYKHVVERMKQLGDRPVTSYDWAYNASTADATTITPAVAPADLSVTAPGQTPAAPKKIDG